MSIKKGNYKLSKYFQLCVILAVVFAGLTTFIGCILYSKNFDYRIEKRQKYAAKQIIKKFDESISYADNITNFVAKRIAKRNGKQQMVASILQDSKPKMENIDDNIFTWTLLDFVNPSGYVIASSALGVVDKPNFISQDKRSWIVSARTQPWKLQFSKKDIGISSGKTVIPLGFGVTGANNNFLGIISLGINIEKLSSVLQSVVSNESIKYALFDENYSLVLSSENFEPGELTDLEHHLESYKNSLKDSDNFEVNDNTFNLEKSKIYPFSIVVSSDNRAITQEFWSTLLPKIIGSIYLTIFFVLLLLFLKRRLLNPIDNLASAADKISQKQFDALVPNSDICEINLLSDAILNFKQLFKKEEDLNAKLKSDHAKDRQENISKNDFLTAAAHDLKNLIAGVMGIAELIRFNINEKINLSEIKFNREELEENLEHLNDIDKCSSDLLDFIHDLLDINQASTGDFKITEESEVNLTDLTRRSIALLETRANKSRQQFIYNINKNSPALIAHNLDSKRIKQILVNLLSNSIKYSKENRKIEIKIERLNLDDSEIVNKQIVENLHNNPAIDTKRRDHLLHLVSKKRNERITRIAITIKDQGFGMDKDQIKIALNKYDSIKNQNTGHIDATGLGLPLIKYLIDTQGGLLEIKSERGVGTEVRVVF